MTALSIRALRKSYAAVPVVRDLSLECGNGELIALLGPSGCGKTTTLRAVAGFERPESGSILFDGRDVTSLLPEQRDVGMVFQDYALFPHLTVQQNCLFGLEMRRVGRSEAARRVADVLEMVQLKGFEKRYPRELSGGQQQRVALARALVIEPAILLLDEPLANLDAVLRDEMRFFIRSLQKRVGITTLYVTHDQSEALLISDRVAVMFEGRIAQLDAPHAIYNRPISRRAASFVGLSNFIDGTIADRRDGTARVATAHGTITALCPASAAPGLRVAIMVRPEAVRLRETGGDGANLLSGTVREAFFLGNAMDYRVLIGSQTIQVQTNPGHIFTPGDAVAVAFDVRDAWVLAE